MEVRINNDVPIGERIGKGVYGNVYLHKNKPDTVFKVIKMYEKTECNCDSAHRSVICSNVLQESTIYHMINNTSHMVNIKYMIDTSRSIAYVMDYAGVSLKKFTDQYDTSPKKAMCMIKEIVSSVSRCMIDVNDKFIINGDIKPDNIMVQRDNVLLTDWSLGKTVVLATSKIHDTLQTLWYRAPERIMDTYLENLNTDVWSLGIIMVELLLDMPGLLSGRDEKEVLCKMAYLFGEESFQCYSNVISSEYKNIIKGHASRLSMYLNIIKKYMSIKEFETVTDLIQKMLQFDPNKRTTFIDVYNHDFLGNVPIKPKSLLDKLDSLPYITVSPSKIMKNYGIREKRKHTYNLIIKLCDAYIDGPSTELVSYVLKFINIIGEKILFDKTSCDRYVIYAFDAVCGVYSFFRPYMCEMIKYFDSNYDGTSKYIENTICEYNNMCREMKYNINAHTGICYVRLLEGYDISDITLYRKTYLEIQKSLCGLARTDRAMARIAMFVVKSIKNINNEQINKFIGSLTYHETIIANKFLNIAKLNLIK